MHVLLLSHSVHTDAHTHINTHPVMHALHSAGCSFGVPIRCQLVLIMCACTNICIQTPSDACVTFCWLQDLGCPTGVSGSLCWPPCMGTPGMSSCLRCTYLLLSLLCCWHACDQVYSTIKYCHSTVGNCHSIVSYYHSTVQHCHSIVSYCHRTVCQKSSESENRVLCSTV